MGAAVSVTAPGEGEEGAAASADVSDEHKAMVYDACYVNFEKRLLPKPGMKKPPPCATDAPPKKTNSLFAAPAGPVTQFPSEPEPEFVPESLKFYAGPWYESLDSKARVELLKEMRMGGRLVEEQIADGTWPAPETPPCTLHYKMDVYDKVRRVCVIFCHQTGLDRLIASD